MLLPLVGAGLGAYQGYRASGGDLGATALGALGGAAVPTGLRMAGTALGGLGAGVLAKTPAGQMMMNQALKSGGVSALTKIPGAAGALAAGAGTLLLGAPALAGSLAAGVTKPVRQALGGGAQVAQQMQSPSGAYPTGPVPQVDAYGNVNLYGSTPESIQDPFGKFQTALAAGRAQTQADLDRLKTIEPYKAYMTEQAKKADFERNLAAAGIRSNIDTQRNILLGQIGTAQQMGLNASQQIGQGLTQTYQYQ